MCFKQATKIISLQIYPTPLMGVKTDINLQGDIVTKNTSSNTAVSIHNFVHI